MTQTSISSFHSPQGVHAVLPEGTQPVEGHPKEIRVLVLDDDKVDVEALRRCLRSIEGMATHLTGCATYPLASKILGESSFDLLFVDYSLGGLTGIEALTRLREEGCQTPAVLLTGSHGEQVLHEALRAGIMDYVPKDRLKPDLMEQTIRSALTKAELNAKIERKQEELERTIESLERRQREIENFYHSVSHELKTPLTGAREFISLVQDGVAGELTGSQFKLLGAAIRNCDQMVRCVNDMFDAARMETGKLVLKSSLLDLVPVLQDAVESVRSGAKDKDVELHTSGMDEPVLTVLDPHRMYQVAANLVSNALKFTPPAGRIDVVLEKTPQGEIRVTVTDTGPGVPVGDEDLVFDRLYQSAEQDAATLGGLGMGLYISREIIELHGGRISYRPAPAGGAEFTFTLPRLPDSNSQGL